MRIKLQLKITSDERILPINYQYAVSSWIYKTLNVSNPEFASWLHEQGFSLKNKRFKLFCFSNIYFEKSQLQGEQIVSYSDNCSIILSFLVPDAAHHFVHGCFKNLDFVLGNKQHKLRLHVSTVEVLPSPQFSESMRFEAITPVCISQIRPINGKSHCEYLSPLDEAYSSLLMKNTLTKHEAYTGEKLSDSKFSLKLLSEPASKLIAITKNENETIFIRGYKFQLELNTSPLLMKTCYYAGLGEKNSMGFGLIKAI